MGSLLEKLIGFLALVTFTVSSCIACSTHVRRTVITTSEQAHTKYHVSITHVVGPVGGGADRSGATGFAISEDHLVTAGHFCESVTLTAAEKKLEKAEILLIGANYDGSHYEIGNATIIAHSKDPDLCLLSAPDHDLVPLPISGAMGIVETEDPITVIGAPASEFPVRREGHVISLLAPTFIEQYEEMMFLSIDIQRGSSGSPVIWYGYVIGVVVNQPKSLHDSCLAVRGDDLVDFIEDHID